MNATVNLIPAWVNGELCKVEKLAVHQRGLRHKAISVFVMDGPRVLLQQRALSKYHTPGLWANTCCTHPHWGESSIDCAKRRLNEELGITGLKLEHRDHVEYRAEVGNGLIEHELVDIFCAEMSPNQSYILNPEEVAQTRWMTLTDLRQAVQDKPEQFTPWLRIYLEAYSDRIFGAELAA